MCSYVQLLIMTTTFSILGQNTTICTPCGENYHFPKGWNIDPEIENMTGSMELKDKARIWHLLHDKNSIVRMRVYNGMSTLHNWMEKKGFRHSKWDIDMLSMMIQWMLFFDRAIMIFPASVERVLDKLFGALDPYQTVVRPSTCRIMRLQAQAHWQQLLDLTHKLYINCGLNIVNSQFDPFERKGFLLLQAKNTIDHVVVKQAIENYIWTLNLNPVLSYITLESNDFSLPKEFGDVGDCWYKPVFFVLHLRQLLNH